MNGSVAQGSFDAVTCRMKFNDIKGFLGNDIKTIKTFAARAKYEYQVEETTLITIEK